MWAFHIFGESHTENLTPENKTPIKKYITDVINPNFVDNYHKLSSQSDQYKYTKIYSTKLNFSTVTLLYNSVICSQRDISNQSKPEEFEWIKYFFNVKVSGLAAK